MSTKRISSLSDPFKKWSLEDIEGQVMVVVPGTLFANYFEGKKSRAVFDIPRLVEFLENKNGLYDLNNAQEALQTLVREIPDGEERLTETYAAKGAVVVHGIVPGSAALKGFKPHLVR